MNDQPKSFTTTIRLPVDLADWLRTRAAHYGGSMNLEMVRCCRQVMDYEVAKDRNVVPTPPALKAGA